jgi:hypothetical protein
MKSTNSIVDWNALDCVSPKHELSSRSFLKALHYFQLLNLPHCEITIKVSYSAVSARTHDAKDQSQVVTLADRIYVHNAEKQAFALAR